MDWQLLNQAIEAEDVASGLKVFLDEVQHFGTDISTNISELFAISSALRGLDKDLDLNRYGRYSSRIMGDLDLVLPSFQYTMDAIRDMFGKSNGTKYPGAFPGTPPYQIIWDDLCLRLKEEGPSLSMRLEYYRTFVEGLHDILRGVVRGDSEVEKLRPRLRRLLRNQESIHGYLERRDLDPHEPRISRRASTRVKSRPTSMRRASSRARTPSRPAPAERLPSYPPYPVVYPPSFPTSPVSETWDPYGALPVAPEVPQSPTFSTTSSQTYSSTQTYSTTDAGNAIGQRPHWAGRIFDGRHGSSHFRTDGQVTKCLGRDEPTAIKLLQEEGFIKVIELPFEGETVWIRVYYNPTNLRARILFLCVDRMGRKQRFCLPLTALKIIRVESSLQLCRVNRNEGQLELWANLRFMVWERMVLFYSTLVSMKRQDQKWKDVPDLEDYFNYNNPGEVQEYGGQIEHGNRLLAFRVFRDRDSGGVRFEVTALRGKMKKTPIWTAFVTEYVNQHNWIRMVDSRTVAFRELRPYVFCDNYVPEKGPTGRYQLRFTTEDDAENFVDIFPEIKVRR